MLNIKKQGSSLLITSSDNSQFPWVDGEMSLPMNSITYVVDESNYITFRSASNNDILFTALIDEIQINGTNVTKDDFILQFDNVANSAGGGGGSASAGVNSINGFQGDLNIKTVNGNSLIGSGDITIEGGSSSSGVEGIDVGGVYLNGMLFFSTSEESSDNSWRVNINGDMHDSSTDEYYGNGGSLIFGVKSSDNSILISENGSLADLVVNPDILSGTSSGSAGVEAINLGENLDESFQKTGVVRLTTSWYDGEYDLSCEGTTFMGFKPIDSSIVLESAGSTANGNTRCGIKVNEWVGTQSEYDALGSYDSGCTYYITE